MKPWNILIGILIFYFTLYIAHTIYVGKTVTGDGVYYYSWLHTLTIDHDLDFRNEFAVLGGFQPKLASGLPANKYAIGPAIFWSQTYIMIHNMFHATGFELPYQIAIGLTDVAAAWVGLVLLFLLLKKYFSENVAIISTVAVATTTNVLFYSALDTVNSHALSFLAATVFMTLILESRPRWFICGLTLGIAGLIRAQDIALGIMTIPFIFRHPKNIYHLALGIFIGFLPQLIAWQALYGKFWISPYLSGGEFFTPFAPNIWGVLFGVRNGLILWTPITLLAFIGMGVRLMTRQKLAIIMIITIAAELYIVASWTIWWQGASFSGRMLVSIMPLFAFGIAEIIKFVQKIMIRLKLSLAQFLLIFVGPLTALNMLLIILFLLTK